MAEAQIIRFPHFEGEALLRAVSIPDEPGVQVRAAALPELHECRVLTDREIVRAIQRRRAKRQYEMSGSLPRI